VKISLGTTSAYSDKSKRYLLQFGRNLLGKNTLDVTVNKAGLLSSANSTTISGVSDALSGLASIAGSVATMGAEAGKPGKAPPCKTDGDHTFVFPEPGTYFICEDKVKIEISR